MNRTEATHKNPLTVGLKKLPKMYVCSRNTLSCRRVQEEGYFQVSGSIWHIFNSIFLGGGDNMDQVFKYFQVDYIWQQPNLRKSHPPSISVSYMKWLKTLLNTPKNAKSTIC